MVGNELEPSVQYFRRDRRRSSISFNDYVRIKASLKQMRQGQKRMKIPRAVPEVSEKHAPHGVDEKKQTNHNAVLFMISITLITFLFLIYLYKTDFL